MHLSGTAHRNRAHWGGKDPHVLCETGALSRIAPILVAKEQIMSTRMQHALELHFITVAEFARLARVSRRTIDRYRRARPGGFPTEYDMGPGRTALPRFKLDEVLRWLESRAL